MIRLTLVLTVGLGVKIKGQIRFPDQKKNKKVKKGHTLVSTESLEMLEGILTVCRKNSQNHFRGNYCLITNT